MDPVTAVTPLSSALAQRVVDSIADTLPHNINIMDRHGLIIAAVDRQRIGTAHRCAQQALRERRTVVTSEPSPDGLTLPGVNAPLLVDGEWIGVVGVTGPPDRVAPLAALVAHTVHLLISQAREHDAAATRMTEARDLLTALSAGTSTAEVVAPRLAALELIAPWSITVLAADAVGPAGHAQLPDEPETLPDRSTAHRSDRAAGRLHGAVWVLRGRGDDPERTGSAGVTGRSASSPPASDPATLIAYAGELRLLCTRARLLPSPTDQAVWTWEHAVTAALTPRATLTRRAEPTARLSAVHRLTLLTLARCGSAQAAAAQMYLHRNTIVQRLERIHTISGLDPRRHDHLEALTHGCYAALALGRIDTLVGDPARNSVRSDIAERSRLP